MDPVVESIDGEVFLTERARVISRRMLLGGFLFLPFLWGVNTWLFWHDGFGRSGTCDPVMRKHVRRSAVCFVVVTSITLTWFLLYAIAGQSLLSPNVYKALDASALDLTQWGFGIIAPNQQ